MRITSAKRIAAAAAVAAMMMSVAAIDASAAPADAAATSATEVNEEAALALARKEDCLKCHSVDKKKDGPSYKAVAAKYKDKPDAEDKLLKHITTGPIVTTAAGDEDEHRIPKTKDEKELRNLLRWILSR